MENGQRKAKRGINAPSLPYVAVGLMGLLLFQPMTAMAQDQAPPGFAVSEDGAAPAAAASGPVRLARISYTTGSVSFRNTEQDSWAEAAPNLPLRQGAELSVGAESRAEVQFDDGSRLRLGPGAVVSLTQLFSDTQGEFTQLTQRGGEISLRLTKSPSVYQIDGPIASVVASGPARYRVDAENGMRVSVYDGQAVIQGSQGKATIAGGSSVSLQTATDPYDVTGLPSGDRFDRWVESQDQQEDGYLNSPDRDYMPSNVAIMTDSLAPYGTWRVHSVYGRVWVPRPAYADWRPYHDGHWVFVQPFGWTWVASEQWGWAPYHYGTWIHEPYGWCWVPGPSTQYWSPAVVSFYQTGANVVWCPLAPAEIVYPNRLAIGFSRGNWSLFFAIGGAAVYYPNEFGRCEPRPWNTVVINRTYVTNQFITGPHLGSEGAMVRNTSFIPYNARMAAGVSMVAANDFGGRGRYEALPSGSVSAFRGGGYFGAPATGRGFSGPSTVRPTALSMAPTRNLQSAPPVNQNVFTRPIVRTQSGTNAVSAARESFVNRTPAAGNTSVRPGAGFSGNGNTRPSGNGAGQPGLNAAQRARQALGDGSTGTTGTQPGNTGNGGFIRSNGGTNPNTSTGRQSGVPTTPTTPTTHSSDGMTAADRARQALGQPSGRTPNPTPPTRTGTGSPNTGSGGSTPGRSGTPGEATGKVFGGGNNGGTTNPPTRSSGSPAPSAPSRDSGHSGSHSDSKPDNHKDEHKDKKDGKG